MSKEGALNMLNGAVPQSPGLVPVEAPKVDAVEVPKELDSDRFARLAQKEAKFQEERSAFKTEQMKVYEEKKQAQAAIAKAQEFLEMKKTDPIGALKYLEFTEEDIFNFMANKKKEEPTQEELARRVAQEELETYKKAEADKEQTAIKERDEKNIAAFKQDIATSITKEAENLKFCNHKGPEAEELVFELVVAMLKDDPGMATHDALKEAFKEAETYFKEDYEAMNSLNKPVPPPEPAKEEPKPLERTNRPKTLTNKATATTASQTPKVETREEKRARLENALRTGVYVKPS